MVSTRAQRATKPSSPAEKTTVMVARRGRKKAAPAVDDKVSEEGSQKISKNEPELVLKAVSQPKTNARARKGVKFADEIPEVKPTPPAAVGRRSTRKTENESAGASEPAAAPKRTSRITDSGSKLEPKIAAAAARKTRSIRKPVEEADKHSTEMQDNDEERTQEEPEEAPKKGRRLTKIEAEPTSVQASKRRTRGADRKVEEAVAPVKKTTRSIRSAKEESKPPVSTAKKTSKAAIAVKTKGKATKKVKDCEKTQLVEDEKASSIPDQEGDEVKQVVEIPTLELAGQPEDERDPISTELEDPFLSRPTKAIKVDIASFRPSAMLAETVQHGSMNRTMGLAKLASQATSSGNSVPIPIVYAPLLQSRTPAPKSSNLQTTPLKLSATVGSKNGSAIGPVQDLKTAVALNFSPRKFIPTKSSILSASPWKELGTLSVLKMPPVSPRKREQLSGSVTQTLPQVSTIQASPRKFTPAISVLRSPAKGGSMMRSQSALLAGSPRKMKLDSELLVGETSSDLAGVTSFSRSLGASLIQSTPMRLSKSSAKTAPVNVPSPIKAWLDATPHKPTEFGIATSPAAGGDSVLDETMMLDEPAFSCIMKSPGPQEQEVVPGIEATPIKSQFEEMIVEDTTVQPAVMEASPDSIIRPNEMRKWQVPISDIADPEDLGSLDTPVQEDVIGKSDEFIHEDDLIMSEFVLSTPRLSSRMATDIKEHGRRFPITETPSTAKPTVQNSDASDDEITPLKQEKKEDNKFQFDETLHFPLTPLATEALSKRDQLDETLHFPETPVLPEEKDLMRDSEKLTPGCTTSIMEKGSLIDLNLAQEMATSSSNIFTFVQNPAQISRPILSPTKSALRSPVKSKVESPKKTVSWDHISPAIVQSVTESIRSPAKQNKILRDMVFYVDVRNAMGEDSASLFIPLLEELGAVCKQHWTCNDSMKITHVLFKDGERDTLQRVAASDGKVKCVNIGWPLDCEKANERLHESKYEIDLSQFLNRTPKKNPLSDLSNNTTPLSSRTLMRTPGTIKSAFKAAKTPFSLYKTSMLKTPQFELALEGKENMLSATKSLGEQTPSTPGFLDPEELVQMTCPPKQTQRTLFQSEKADIKRRMEFNKRRSLGFALGAGSPMKRARLC